LVDPKQEHGSVSIYFKKIRSLTIEFANDLVLVNITTTQFGALLSTGLSKLTNSFGTTFNEALKMAVDNQ
jgi:hypothetical protein